MRIAIRNLGTAVAVGAAGLALGCGTAPTDRAPVDDAGTPEMCSQLHRALSRWQGQEDPECGADVTGLLELTPIGNHQILVRRRFTTPYDLWTVSAAGEIGEAPTPVFALDGGSTAGFAFLPGSVPQVLVYDPTKIDWGLYTTGVSPQALADVLVVRKSGVWPSKSAFHQDMKGTAGHELIGLENGHLLDRDLGDGSTRIWQVVSTDGGQPDIALVANLAGPSRDELRRGHRVVPLGAGRLLEWLPRPCDARAAPGGVCLGADYRVWSYTLDDAAGARDPLDRAPVSSGFWSGIGPGDDLVADDANLFVWTRKDGLLRSYPLDPTAIGADPPRWLGERMAPALQSLDWKPPTAAPEIKHLVVILQNGRSFDSYFGQYCQLEQAAGPPGCETGPACCEAMHPSVPGAARCAPIGSSTDTDTDLHVPESDPECMRSKIAGGAMTDFALAPPQGSCGDPLDFACAVSDPAAGTPADYWRLAATSALADNFFQSYGYADGPHGPVVGIEAVENLLYLVTARFGDKTVFTDKPLLTKELARVEVPWAVYAGPSNLSQVSAYGLPIFHDPSWYPFRALAAGEFDHDVDDGQLPSVAVVLPDDGDRATSESPGHPPGPGIAFVGRLLDKIAGSPLYQRDTLVLLTYLTAGGYYDHVPPPSARELSVDGTSSIPTESGPVAYGPRVPLLVFPPFAQPNHISHEPLEMSSITLFIEWNWIHGNTLKGAREGGDARAYRDTVVSNLGSLIDPVAAGIQVPIHHD